LMYLYLLIYPYPPASTAIARESLRIRPLSHRYLDPLEA